MTTQLNKALQPTAYSCARSSLHFRRLLNLVVLSLRAAQPKGTMIFLERYIQFLNELEHISQNHDELTDTDVRERLREVINYYFVWGNPVGADFSRRYSMLTPEGDGQVFEAVQSFISEAQTWADNNGMPIGQTRHSLLENEEAITAQGNEYYLFLGFRDDVLPEEKPSSDVIFEYSEDDE